MVDVWIAKIPQTASVNEWTDHLLPLVAAETAREVAAYRHEGAALRRLVGELLVRYYLHEKYRLGANDYRILRGEKGKPYIDGVTGLHFNLSHAGEYVVAAFSDRPVGVDIEAYKRARMRVADRFFHPEEIAELHRLQPQERDRRFIDYWAIKESFLKYLGTGLTRPLSTFQVIFSGGSIAIREGETLAPLHLLACPVDTGYACYLCAEQENITEARRVDPLSF